MVPKSQQQTQKDTNLNKNPIVLDLHHMLIFHLDSAYDKDQGRAQTF